MNNDKHSLQVDLRKRWHHPKEDVKYARVKGGSVGFGRCSGGKKTTVEVGALSNQKNEMK